MRTKKQARKDLLVISCVSLWVVGTYIALLTGHPIIGVVLLTGPCALYLTIKLVSLIKDAISGAEE